MTKKTFTFIHVNKCGGRSINHALTELFRTLHVLRAPRPEETSLRSGVTYSESHGLVNTPITPKTPGNLILFVRDPVSRFISSYHYGASRKRPFSGMTDVNELIDTMRKNKTAREQMFKENLHFGYSLSRYISPENICKLDFYFVGTTENIRSDFKVLVEKILDDRSGGDIRSPSLPHFNNTRRRRQGKLITKENIVFLRELYSRDYQCLLSLHSRGYLSKEYIDKVFHNEKYVY